MESLGGIQPDHLIEEWQIRCFGMFRGFSLNKKEGQIGSLAGSEDLA
jgi:hypothetical protein